MNSFIDSWKKENQTAKKDGKVTEQEADFVFGKRDKKS